MCLHFIYPFYSCDNSSKIGKKRTQHMDIKQKDTFPILLRVTKKKEQTKTIIYTGSNLKFHIWNFKTETTP